jgi:hypothetical protein
LSGEALGIRPGPVILNIGPPPLDLATEPSPAATPSAAANGQPDLTSTITGDRPIKTAALVTPMARALMDGYGTIDLTTDETDGRSARVVLTFDQGANP